MHTYNAEQISCQRPAQAASPGRIIESGLGYAPYGVIGIGESLGAVTTTILAGAVYNATGKWITNFPITPDKVLKALGKM